MKTRAKSAFFGFISSLISAKTGINYPDLEPGNEFWNWVQVPSSYYKSLSTITTSTVCEARPWFVARNRIVLFS